MPGQARRSIGARAAGTNDSVANPTAIRTKVTPSGASASRPSAMNRNDAPQMRPGSTSSAQSVARGQRRRLSRLDAGRAAEHALSACR